jgi:TonB family protein
MAMPLRSGSLVLSLLLILSGTALAQTDRFERVGELASEGRFKEAAGELRKIAEEGIEPSPAERKLLGQAIKASRPALKGPDSKAARLLLCRSRAYFSEELPDTVEPLRSLGSGYPQVLGKVTAHRTEAARKVGLQGTVILEVVVDSEGCVRNPRVLKGLPFGLNEAATAAIRSWAFEPARFQGRPVAVYYVIPVAFPAKE